MKTGIQSAAYFDIKGSKEGFLLMKSHGYDCTDYQNFVNTENDLFKLSNKEFESHLLLDKEYASEAGIEIYQTHAPWRYPPMDATVEDRMERLDKMKKAIWGTSVLGSKYFVIHPVMPYGPSSDPEPEKFIQINYEFMSSLIPFAKDHGVVICLENMPMTSLSLSKPSEILQFVKNINSDFFKICIDTGHCAVFNESPADAVRLTGKYLKVLHVHDNNGKSDLHWLPYNGVIDWSDFNKALHEVNFEGPVSIETQVSGKLPCDLKEYFQKGLFKIAKKLAE